MNAVGEAPQGRAPTPGHGWSFEAGVPRRFPACRLLHRAKHRRGGT